MSSSDLQTIEVIGLLPDSPFPVVGVGASAGGLEAFKKLLGALPEDPGIALILVQHLEPSHESLLADLLQKVSSIPIGEITDKVAIEINHIYILPPNRSLTAEDGRLLLSPRPPKNKKNMPIDVFFSSLAAAYGEHAIGVVLSGSATDGTLGLKEIKDHGGLTFAQDPESAAFAGMPQSAIETGAIDFILTPEQISLQLVTLTKTFSQDHTNKDSLPQVDKERALKELLHLLRLRKGADFTYYKQTTIQRRIVRRMGLNKIEQFADYVNYFKEHIQEQELLYQDLLIPVTGFFRDPKTYEILSDSIFPALLRGKELTNPLRIWIAGCSTGEEPYSMAMCLYEFLGDAAADHKIQIFATDISDNSIAKARNGIYSKKDVTGLSAQRLQRFFVKTNGSFQINKFIRDMCVFARHNFLKDPPFAKMDLVSCRNVLIYMEAFLQKKALTTFHYALNEHGYLLLGKSETVAPASGLFAAVHKTDKIYIRKSVPGRVLPATVDFSDRVSDDKAPFSGKRPLRDDFQKSADEVLLARHTPPGVVVNEQMEILQFRGSTGTWLEPSPGKPNLNVLKMAREGLAFELRNALNKVKATHKAEEKEHIPIVAFGIQKWVTLQVIPLPNTVERYYLILFREDPLPADNKVVDPNPQGIRAEQRQSDEDLHIQRLEKELAQLRADIAGITEDQDATNEELQSTNEELLSSSEELQSLNEELETSKEEIQSTNEELTTLNQELYDRNEQLNLSRLYAESIVATIREPLVVLDKDMKVKTANRSWYRKFGTTEEQTEGKSLYALDNKQWDLPALRDVLERVRSLNEKMTDFELRYLSNTEERVLLLNASRIFREDNAELMILLAVEDTTEAKKREADLLTFSQELESMVQDRTTSLKETNAALQHSNANLEQFATIASHDLQEPLRKIRTFAALLNRSHSQDITAEAKELLQKIGLSAERMSVLIQDVLNFSKVLDASIFERTDLDAIFNDVIGDFDLLIAEKRAVVRADRLPVIQAVPLQMNQLFYNLLSNALKFSSPDSSPVIRVSSKTLTVEETAKHRQLDAQKVYIEICMEDNGIGFDQQFSRQIFLIFQRLNRNEHFEGTGIGLALCQRIVTNHRGVIYAEATAGRGARFCVILPIEQTGIFLSSQ